MLPTNIKYKCPKCGKIIRIKGGSDAMGVPSCPKCHTLMQIVYLSQKPYSKASLLDKILDIFHFKG